MAGWEYTAALRAQIHRYALYKQTSLSLRQMVQFGLSPSPGSIFLALQFIVEELPIRLAFKVKDLEEAPFGLNDMPLTQKVRDWYAQSFQELVELPKPEISDHLKKLLAPNGQAKTDTPSENIARIESKSPSVHNLFADDGIVVRHHDSKSLHDKHDRHDRNDKSQTATPPPDASPTYGKRYYTPCQANIVWPKEVYDYNKSVCEALQKIKKRHDATVATMAQGVQEWKAQTKTYSVNSQIQTFLDRFYMSRIGIRMLIGQQVALNMAQASPTKQRLNTLLRGQNGTPTSTRSNYVGVICTDCNVAEIAQDAIDTAQYICEEYYGLFEAPEIQLIAPLNEINFMYVPGHLIHMLFETLKNSLRATIEFHLPKLKKELMAKDPSLEEDKIDINDLKFPPIKVIILEGTEDIAIKISDEGGGIPRSEIPLIWTYLYTTVSERPVLDSDQNQSFRAPMAGFGYGLPILRLYAQYFGGDLKLISMEGYGTDVYLHLNRLSSSLEPLP